MLRGADYAGRSCYSNCYTLAGAAQLAVRGVKRSTAVPQEVAVWRQQTLSKLTARVLMAANSLL